MEEQTRQLDALQERVRRLEQPLIVRIIRGIWRLLFGTGGVAKPGAVNISTPIREPNSRHVKELVEDA
jgi:hypothetical protein